MVQCTQYWDIVGCYNNMQYANSCILDILELWLWNPGPALSLCNFTADATCFELWTECMHMHVAFYTSMDLQNFSLFGFGPWLMAMLLLLVTYVHGIHGEPYNIHSIWRKTILTAVFVYNLASCGYLLLILIYDSSTALRFWLWVCSSWYSWHIWYIVDSGWTD